MTRIIALRHATGAGFLARAGARLERAEAENNVLLGVAGGLARHPQRAKQEPWLLTLEPAPAPGAADAAEPLGAAVMTPPFKLMISRTDGDDGLAALADTLHAAGAPVPGILGQGREAEVFARLWSAGAGRAARRGMSQRVFECFAIAPAAAARARRVPGAFRPATEAEEPLLADWCDRMNRETGLNDPIDPVAIVRRKTADGELFVWETGTRAVSMAALARATRRGIGVNLVYTPPDLRGRGYASACVTALTQRALDAGRRFCFLHTDLANPTSNAIYERIGYRGVCDLQVWDFAPGAGEGRDAT